MRHYKRKTTRGQISKEIILRAIATVKDGTYTNVSQAARRLSIPKRSLARWFQQFISSELVCGQPKISAGFSKPKMVFSVNQELDIVRYLETTSSDSKLTPTDTRKLAYSFAMVS